MKPSVVSNNNVISTFFKKPKCEFPTILDMLEIKDAVIANCLIDQVMNLQYQGDSLNSKLCFGESRLEFQVSRH